MSDVDVFVIDDDFDPLADLSLDDGERDDAEADYLPPIPDADKSVVPPVVPLSAAERIENLLAGIPGQQFRLLHAVEFCTEPKTMDEAVAASVLSPLLGASRAQASSLRSRWQTWWRACTPASVRPATVVVISSREAMARAASISPWTVRRPGWAAHPRKSVPS